MLSLLLLFAACAAPEEECLLPPRFTEDEATRFVAGGVILVGNMPDCEGAAWCVRDRTVPMGAPSAAASGYCAVPCELGCRPGTRCREIDGKRLCLHQ
ncbi:MAG: hypothetical protein Q8N23_13940 [Archangium sp.]|nr:hypothetical protein [Archangium sp.]MDP3153774.1 hypothetical protein [Archangium sp.]MDP3575667.1 hypothetical protein [Archangium sp.]